MLEKGGGEGEAGSKYGEPRDGTMVEMKTHSDPVEEQTGTGKIEGRKRTVNTRGGRQCSVRREFWGHTNLNMMTTRCDAEEGRDNQGKINVQIVE